MEKVKKSGDQQREWGGIKGGEILKENTVPPKQKESTRENKGVTLPPGSPGTGPRKLGM